MSLAVRGRRALLIPVAVVAFALATSAPGAAQVPPQYEAALKQMLEAVRTGSYAQFVAPGDSRFKTGYTEKMFGDLNGKLARRLEGGYSTSYLGQLRQRGYVVYVWKLSLEDRGDDLLLTLFTGNGKVSGFIPR